MVQASVYPCTLYARERRPGWVLHVHGLGQLALVANDAAARHAAARALTHRLNASVSPTQVHLIHREAPAATLARLAADPGLSVSDLAMAAMIQ